MAEHSRTHRRLAAVAAALAALALVAGDPRPARRGSPAARDVPYVTALDLARWIRDGKPGVRILDARSATQFAEYHVPGAEHVALDTVGRRERPPVEVVVVYASDDARSAEALRRLRSGSASEAYVLRGGLLAWVDQIVEPLLPALPTSATPEQRAARREHLELSRYFGGMPVVSSGAAPLPHRPTPTEAAAVGRSLRRGC